MQYGSRDYIIYLIKKEVTFMNNIKYVGTDDLETKLFEGQYIIPDGVSYNSYLIDDDKTVLIDTVDEIKTKDFMNNVKSALGSKTLDYIIVSHLESDHSGCLEEILKAYPSCKIIGNEKLFSLLPRYIKADISERKVTVKENEIFDTGSHKLKFIFAPMIHWPEVMVTLDEATGILFSADAFGKFGAKNINDEWDCEARRYYFNIVGKYGNMVQTLLKKLSAEKITAIYPLHGPELKENLSKYINLYNTWSSYEPEVKGVFIAYASLHHNTEKACFYLKEQLEKLNVKVSISNLYESDMAENVEDAFKYDRIVLASSTCDGMAMPLMAHFIYLLKAKNFQKRKIAFIENGTWAPVSAKAMQTALDGAKDLSFAEKPVTLTGKFTDEYKPALDALAKDLAEI